jgi:hypothetical protein
MSLPCEDLFNKLESAMKKSEQCWFEADLAQSGATLAGIGASIACPSVLVAADSGSAAGFFKTLAACSVSSTGFLVGLAGLLLKTDNCNVLDLEALDAAKDFNKCAGEHKEFLNSLLKPKR